MTTVITPDGEVLEFQFGRDIDGRFDPHVLAHQIDQFGADWARARAAAELLEQTSKPFLSRLTNKALADGRLSDIKFSRRQAEDVAMASDDYEGHLRAAIDARQAADIAKARWVAVQALSEGLRTQEASRRAERSGYRN
jgi:hypothetical protein